MKKKLIIVVVVALLGVGGAYKFVLAGPKKAEAKPKVEGDDLRAPEGVPRQPRRRPLRQAAGRARASSPPAGGRGHGGGHGAPAPPEGYGSEPQEAIVRDLITDTLTDAADHELIKRDGREQIKKKILGAIKKHTDVHVEEVLFPDVTVQ